MKTLVPALATLVLLACAGPGAAVKPVASGAAHQDGDVEGNGEYVRPTMILPFIEDDFDLALKTAKEKNLPIFVDAWVSW